MWLCCLLMTLAFSETLKYMDFPSEWAYLNGVSADKKMIGFGFNRLSHFIRVTWYCIVVVFNVPPTTKVIWRQSHSLVSSNRLVKPGIAPPTPGLHGERFIHYTTAAPYYCTWGITQWSFSRSECNRVKLLGFRSAVYNKLTGVLVCLH